MKISSTASTAASGVFRIVPIAEVFESPLNPRKHFDADALGELADSIRVKGVITPLLARPRAEGGYELAAGHRRRRAAELAGLKELPVLVREMADADFLEVLTIENLQRVDVSAMDEAAGFRLLIDTWRSSRPAGKKVNQKQDVVELAKRLGKSVSHVYGRLKLLELCPAGQERLAAGAMTASHAILIARLPESQQTAALAEMDEYEEMGDTLSVGALETLISQSLLIKLDSAPFDRDDAKLYPLAGDCLSCPKRAGNAQELFPGVDQNTCTDGACFDLKVAAIIDSKCREGAVRVERWKGHTEITGPECATTIDGVFINQRDAGRVARICMDKLCPQHGQRTVNDVGDHRKQELEKAKIAKAEALRRSKMLCAVLERVRQGGAGAGLPREVLELAVAVFWEEAFHESRKKVSTVLGWDPVPASLRDDLALKSDGEITCILLALMTARELSVSPYDNRPPRILRALDGFYGTPVQTPAPNRKKVRLSTVQAAPAQASR